MSSACYSEDCPKCKCIDSLMISEDSNPFSLYAECVECGYYYKSSMTYGRLALEDLNDTRDSHGLEEITKLPKVKM